MAEDMMLTNLRQRRDETDAEFDRIAKTASQSTRSVVALIKMRLDVERHWTDLVLDSLERRVGHAEQVSEMRGKTLEIIQRMRDADEAITDEVQRALKL